MGGGVHGFHGVRFLKSDDLHRKVFENNRAWVRVYHLDEGVLRDLEIPFVATLDRVREIYNPD